MEITEVVLAVFVAGAAAEMMAAVETTEVETTIVVVAVTIVVETTMVVATIIIVAAIMAVAITATAAAMSGQKAMIVGADLTSVLNPVLSRDLSFLTRMQDVGVKITRITTATDNSMKRNSKPIKNAD